MRRRVRRVGEEGSKSEGAANGRERERAGGRRSRRTGKGGGDPGREVGGVKLVRGGGGLGTRLAED